MPSAVGSPGHSQKKSGNVARSTSYQKEQSGFGLDDDDRDNETRHIKKQNEAMNLAFKLDEKISYIDELYQT